MVSLFAAPVVGRISCFYVLIPKHFTDTQAIVYVRFSDSSSVPNHQNQIPNGRNVECAQNWPKGLWRETWNAERQD